MRRKDMHVSDVMVAVHGGCDGSVSRQWRRSWCRRCDTGCSGNGNCERCGDGNEGGCVEPSRKVCRIGFFVTAMLCLRHSRLR